jgi:hypothetical protein
MRSILAGVFCAALIAGPAQAFTCDQVRSFVAGKSAAELDQLAKQYGVSAADIAKGKACLAGPKRATARASRSARHGTHRRTARTPRPHPVALPLRRPVVADERYAPPVVAEPPAIAPVERPAVEPEPNDLPPAIAEPAPASPPVAEPKPKGHPMLQWLTNLFAGLSWSTLILIAIVCTFVARNGAPSVKAWFGRMRGYVGAAEAEIRADIAALKADLEAVKLHVGIPVPPAPPTA